MGVLVLAAFTGAAAQGAAQASSPPTEQLAVATFDQDLMVSLITTKGSGGGAGRC
jgi:hypothetical protein